MTQTELEYTVLQAIKEDTRRNIELCDQLSLKNIADIMRVTLAALDSIDNSEIKPSVNDFTTKQ